MTKISRDWKDVTHQRSFSGQMRGHLELNVKEVPIKEQIHKLARKMKQVEAQIKHLIHRGIREPVQRAEIERSILNKNKLYFIMQKRMNKLQGLDNAVVKRKQTLKEEMAMHIKNVEDKRAKIKPKPVTIATGNDGFHPEQDDFKYRSFAKDGTVKKYMPFTQTGAPPKEKVTVKNPNEKKGTVFLPFKTDKV